MPNIRIGFSSDFVLKNGVVGLGTTVGSTTDGKLELGDGDIRGNFSVSGVATFTAYGGFVAQKQHVNKPAVIGFGTVGLNTAGAAIGVGATHITNQYYETETGFTDLGGVHHGDDQYFNTLSEDLIIDDGQILNITNTAMSGVTTIGEYDPHNHSSYVCAGSLEQVSVTEHFSVPCGGTNERQVAIEGTVRFNDDLNTLEFFNGNEWRQFTYNQGQSGRGVLTGGSPVGDQRMEYFNLHTLGNSQFFGDTVHDGRYIHGCCGSETRGLIGGGYDDSEGDNSQSDIEYFTIASAGNSIDFGDLDAQHFRNSGACSSSTRGLFFGGGHPSYYDTIEYVQINTLGNALDFGDQVTSAAVKTSFSSSTRGFSFGGFPAYSPKISVVTIASTGDATTFGELSSAGLSYAGSSNSVRGIFAGGYTADTNFMRSINYITMASEGNAQYFGDLTQGRDYPGGMATQTRAVFCGGLISNPNTYTNLIDYVNIASAGSAVDFGDIREETYRQRGTTDSHGGLGGF
jgi:hypothetical protein